MEITVVTVMVTKDICRINTDQTDMVVVVEVEAKVIVVAAVVIEEGEAVVELAAVEDTATDMVKAKTKTKATETIRDIKANTVKATLPIMEHGTSYSNFALVTRINICKLLIMTHNIGLIILYLRMNRVLTRNFGLQLCRLGKPRVGVTKDNMVIGKYIKFINYSL